MRRFAQSKLEPLNQIERDATTRKGYSKEMVRKMQRASLPTNPILALACWNNIFLFFARIDRDAVPSFCRSQGDGVLASCI